MQPNVIKLIRLGIWCTVWYL